jgi:hypothetical protein
MPQPASVRGRVVEVLQLCGSAEAQLKYEESVPLANVPGELLAFISDVYQPTLPEFISSFTDAELRTLARIYGMAMEASERRAGSVHELLKVAEWRRVMALASQALRDFSHAA